MLPGAHALRALTPMDRLLIQRGSCVRHRFAASTCSACFDICPTKAFDWRETGLHWEAGQCQGCLLCVASCPSGALQGSEISFVSLLQELTKVDRPVLACSARPETLGHARLPCLGILAHTELLLAIQLALGSPLQLNLTACADCQNNAIIEPLQKTLKKLDKVPTMQPDSIELIREEKQLHYQERSCSRREFFSLLRNRSQHAGSCIAERLQAENNPVAYGVKELPATRKLLLQIFEYLPAARKEISATLFPHVKFSADCRACTGCVGICPTGALLPPEENGSPPAFQAESCTGCKLCEQFCSRSGLKITQSN